MNNMRKAVFAVLIGVSISCIMSNSFAHSGRTDSSGGHKDNKNASGLGSYHYHCGGYPPHLHTNGVCPYSQSKSNTLNSSSSSDKSTTSNSTSSNTKITNTSSPITATSVQINEKIEEMKVGETQKLTATILPYNTTDKDIIWECSDESVVTINTSGEIEAKIAGEVSITVSTSNSKTDTVKISVKEEEIENNTIMKTSMNNSNENNNVTEANSSSSNAVDGVVVLGLLGGVGYWGYKKYKKVNK